MTYQNRRFRGDSHEHGHWHQHGHWHEHGRGRGPRRRRFGSREELISALEGYQRNLEERAADVAETIRRVRDKESVGLSDKESVGLSDKESAGLSDKESVGAENPEGTDATPTTHTI